MKTPTRLISFRETTNLNYIKTPKINLIANKNKSNFFHKILDNYHILKLTYKIRKIQMRMNVWKQSEE